MQRKKAQCADYLEENLQEADKKTFRTLTESIAPQQQSL